MGVNTGELVGGCKRSGTGVRVSMQWNWCVGVNTVERVCGCKRSGTGVWV